MKIVIFALWFYDYIVHLANMLSKKGDVLLILPKRANIEDLNHKNIKLYQIEHPPYIFYPSGIFDVLNTIKKIKEYNPDIIHFQVTVGLFLPLMLQFIRKYNLIATFHDVKPHVGEESLLYRLVMYFSRRYSDQIIVHGQKLKEQMNEEYNISKDKINVVPIGAYEVELFKKFEKKDIKEEGNLVLFFGRIHRYKGLDYLIDAEPIITKALVGVKIIIAGTGESFKKYEDLMINRDNFIVYNDLISYKDGAKLFQKASIVVLPYVEASQSGVIPIAYGFKKPVIATDVGALSEIVENGKTGLIVPPKDSKVLAESIIKLLRNNDLRKKMGEKGYQKLKTDLSWDRIAEKTWNVYSKVIKK